MSLKKKGAGIIFVSHDMDTVAKNCDTVMFLKEGKVDTIGTPEKAISAYLEALKQ